MVFVPDSARVAAEQARARLGARRREVLIVLRLAESTASYAVAQVADGLGPVAAWAAATDAAWALVEAASALVRLTQLEPGERAALAAELVSAGVDRRDVADLLNVTPQTVRGYLRSG